MNTKNTNKTRAPWYRTWRFELVAAFFAVVCAVLLHVESYTARGLLVQDVARMRQTVSVPSSSARRQYTPILYVSPYRSSSSSSRRSSVMRAKTSSSVKRPTVPQTKTSSSLRAAAPAAAAQKAYRRAAASARAILRPAAPVQVEGPAAGIETAKTTEGFPLFQHTSFPVGAVPNWGAMHGAAEWGRSYTQMTSDDFVAVPQYDLNKLSTPFQSLVQEDNEPEITRKLFYSTKFFGAYDLDAGEYTWLHPGVDLKLALGTPVGAIAGGRVHSVSQDSVLGIHVIIEHHFPSPDGTMFSIYGHLGSTTVHEGQDVVPGQTIGFVGMTGNTSAPHLHLQVDRDRGSRPHEPYRPSTTPTRGEADVWTVNPIRLIERYAGK